MPDLLDGTITIVTIVGGVLFGLWVAGRDRRRHDAEVDRRIEQRYRHG
jgi:hypothetical protein